MTDKKFNKKLSKLLKKKYGKDFNISDISYGFKEGMSKRTMVINGEIFSSVFTVEAKVHKFTKESK